MKTVLEQLGCHVDVSSPPRVRPRLGGYDELLLALKSRLIRQPWVMREVETKTNATLGAFIAREVRPIRVYTIRRTPRRGVAATYGSFVVGSDQVWRPLYTDVEACMLNFVPATSQVTRISYAGSFGLDDDREYSAELAESTKELAARFDALSAREQDGCTMAREIWGRDDVQRHVDPTLLLLPGDYSVLVESDKDQDIEPRIGAAINYTLDPGQATTDLLRRVADHAGAELVDLLPPAPCSPGEYREHPESFVKPSIGYWLASIRGAKIVLTDSFHGCVFSILFNVPFVAISNEARGASRFRSLLSMFGLENRMLTPEAPVDAERLQDLVSREIDWPGINLEIARQRERALAYLRSHLSPQTEQDALSVVKVSAGDC